MDVIFLKVAIIHGQNHKGCTYNIAKILANNLTTDENDIKEFFLPRDFNHFCLGCYLCLEDKSKCPFYNEKEVIINALEQADIFIFTSPCYCLAPSAGMISFLDMMFDAWMVHKPYDWMFSKRAVIISTSAGASTKSTLKTIYNSLFYWGVPYIKSYGIAVQASNWNMVKSDKKEKINKDMKRLAEKISSDQKPVVGIKTRFMFSMMGKMHKAGFDSSPSEKIYWDKYGWLQKERPWKKSRKQKQ